MDEDIFYEIFNNSQEAILVLDNNKNIIAVNNTFSNLTNYGRDELINRSIFDIELFGSFSQILKNAWDDKKNDGYWEGELLLNKKLGISIPVWAEFKKTTKEKNILYIITALDISHKKMLENSLDFLRNYDALTGLPNKNLLDDRLKQSIATAKRMKLKVGVLYIDIDNFKLINDNFGYPGGDILIQKFIKRLLPVVRETDTLSRISSDNFVLICFGIKSDKEILIIINRLREALRDPFYIYNNRITITISVGACLYPDDTEDPLKLINLAESALESAKEMGRNTYLLYNTKDTVNIEENFAILSRLGEASKRDEFVLYYQPKVSLKSDKIVGAEALIRWNHPTLGLVSPMRFIPLAETYGYIKEVGEWVVNKVCMQLLYWSKKGINIENISINISPLQFNDKNLRLFLEEVINKYNIEPKRLELELTESMIMKDFNISLGIMEELKKLNILLSLDDFGTGYSSLSYLSKLPIDIIKIDRSFVMRLKENEYNRKIINMIVQLTKSLDIKVIAEGVETKEQYDILKSLGCDEYQGYYYSKPITCDDFEHLWNNNLK
ncbi:MAG: EAL domain-containing protein [Deferribacterota bacterium]|nr:EAL domain-containing protein [Deferribacterota bacterium]